MHPLLQNLFVGFVGVSVALTYLLVRLWLLAKREAYNGFSRPLERSWATEPRPFPEPVAALDAAWRTLGYVPAGILVAGEHPNRCFVIYTHPSEPIFASTFWQKVGRGDLARPTLLTYYADGGKLTTTSFPGVGGNTAAFFQDGSRLVQFRLNASPEALDYQHRRALEEWRAQRRQPLPADRDALIRYSVADHEALRPVVAAHGWLPFIVFLGIFTGNPPGVRRF